MHVRAPRNDQPGMGKVLRRRPQLHSIHAQQRRPARSRTDRPVQLRGAQPVEEPPVHRPVSQLPNRPGIAVRQHALRPKLRRDLLQPRRNLIQRLVPGDPLETPPSHAPAPAAPSAHPPSAASDTAACPASTPGPDTSPPSRTEIPASPDAMDRPASSPPGPSASSTVTNTPHESGQSCEQTACTTFIASKRAPGSVEVAAIH